MKVSIIGAGFSGLTLAYFLNKKGMEVELLESSSRAGGLLHTKQLKHGLVESAATSVLLTPELSSLLEDLNLNPVFSNKESKKKFFSKNHTPRRLPLSFLGILVLLRGLIRILLNKQKWKPQRNQSLSDWADILFNTEVRKAVISPALQGIYADSSENLSASLILGKFFSPKKRAKSQGAINFSGGMSEFIQAIESHLKNNGVTFKYNCSVTAQTLPGNPVVIATSMKQAKEFIGNIPDLPFKDMTSVTLFFRAKPPVEGFGILFPKEENLNSLGVLLNDCMFEGRTTSGHSETWIMNAVGHETDKTIISLIKNDRLQLFKSEEKPTDYSVNTSNAAFPVYGKELESYLEKPMKLPKYTYVTGNYLGNMGLSGILQQNRELSNKITGELQ